MRSFETQRARHPNYFSVPICVGVDSGSGPTPKRVEKDSSNASHSEPVLFQCFVGRPLVNLPEDAIVAFKCDQEIISISSLAVPTLVAVLGFPARNQPVIITFFRKEVVRVGREEFRVRCGCITFSAPHSPAWFEGGNSRPKIGTKYSVGPCPPL